MIHIDRHFVSREPDSTECSVRSRQREAEAILEGAEHNPQRDIYAHEEVRAALHRLFHEKCAYCEAKIPGRTGWDVEHFRPKRRVRERPDHPGYYWLAYRWTNLYAVCGDCNRHLNDTPTWEHPRGGSAGGKHDQFPLADEGTRAMHPGAPLDLESRLLLDPCIDRPEAYLHYDPRAKTSRNLLIPSGGDDRSPEP